MSATHMKMDKTLQALADLTASITWESLPPGAIHHTKKLLVDSIACGIGGYTAEASAISRKVAARASGTPSATLIGCGTRTSAEMAAFANSVMVRYLDFNDTYTSVGEGHPSDMLPAVLAAAQGCGASGRATIAALAAAYEVYMALADCVGLAERGWDHGYFVVIAAAAGAGHVLGLDRLQMMHAFSLAATANVPTRQTRRGELSMWKACSTATSAREGVFSVLLAREGMTGPPEAFEGRHGVWDQVTGPFTLPAATEPRRYGVERSGIKYFPTEYHSHVPLALVLQLRERFDLAEVESILLEGYHRGVSEVGEEPERWDPQTRETADHSLPYMLAVLMADGRLDVDSFDDARILDPSLRPLMKKIAVREDPALTALFPHKLRARITVTTKDGRQHTAQGDYPKGHEHDPMTDDEVNDKFDSLCGRFMPAVQARALRNAIWGLDDAASIEPMMALTVFDRRG